jgi:hypothetical protein
VQTPQLIGDEGGSTDMDTSREVLQSCWVKLSQMNDGHPAFDLFYWLNGRSILWKQHAANMGRVLPRSPLCEESSRVC